MNPNTISFVMVIVFCVGVVVGALTIAIGFGELLYKYPIIGCIREADNDLFDNYNIMYTEESLVDVFQWQCANQYVDFNITDDKDLFVYGNKTDYGLIDNFFMFIDISSYNTTNESVI